MSEPRARVPTISAALVLALVATACGDDGPTSVDPGEGPTILSVTPPVLTPGTEAVLEGGNFHPTAGSNTVRVWESEATVLEASETSLRIRLPGFVCGPEGDAPVTVTVGAETADPFHHPFEPVGVTELQVGELIRIGPSQERCLILGGSSSRADYLVGSQSTTGVVGTVTGVRHRGLRGGAHNPSAAAAGHQGRPFAQEVERRRAQAASSGGALAGSGEFASRLTAHRRAEIELRQRERRLLDRSLLSAVRAGAARTSAQPKVPGTVEPGDTVSLNVPDLSTDNFCQNGRPIDALVRRVGEHSIWVEDVENPDGGFTSDDYDFLSDEFDNQIYEEVTSYFGEPTDLDGNGRVVIVISQAVNRITETGLAFVVSVDFFPGQCPGGNGGEYYYARAPDPNGVVPGPDGETGNGLTREQARSFAPLILAHEVTHIIQFGRRLEMPGIQTLQESWILEGQATLAEEVMGHHYAGNQPRTNLGPQTLFADHPPTEVAWYLNGFFGLVSYFGLGFDNGSPFRVTGAPHECTWLTVEDFEPCDSVLVAYGTTWSFLRWMSDHFGEEFPGGEQEFQKRIVDSPRSGFSTFEELLAVPKEELLAPWAASLFADGRALSNPDPLVTFPSWDLLAVEDGVIPQAHLIPASRTFSAFETTVQVAAGSTYYQHFRGVGGHPPFAVSARTGTGDSLPDQIQLWVVRLR